MKKIFLIALLPLVCLISSCSKEPTDTIIIEGIVRDDLTLKSIRGVSVSASAVSAVGFGRNEEVGRTITDADGHYRLQLKIFKEAERLDFDINGGNLTDGYTYIQESIYTPLPDHHLLDFRLNPTALLKIKFKNATPVSNSDFFYFGWDGTGWTKGIVNKEYCGSIMPSQASTWTGKDVCGIYTIERIAERTTLIYWSVTKNNIITNYRDTVYVRRGIVNEFSLNY